MTNRFQRVGLTAASVAIGGIVSTATPALAINHTVGGIYHGLHPDQSTNPDHWHAWTEHPNPGYLEADIWQCGIRTCNDLKCIADNYKDPHLDHVHCSSNFGGGTVFPFGQSTHMTGNYVNQNLTALDYAQSWFPDHHGMTYHCMEAIDSQNHGLGIYC